MQKIKHGGLMGALSMACMGFVVNNKLFSIKLVSSSTILKVIDAAA